MAETSTIFGFMKYVSATDILSDFKKTVDSHFVNSLKGADQLLFSYVMRGALARFEHRKTGSVTILCGSYLYFTVSTTVAFTFERSMTNEGRTPTGPSVV